MPANAMCPCQRGRHAGCCDRRAPWLPAHRSVHVVLDRSVAVPVAGSVWPPRSLWACEGPEHRLSTVFLACSNMRRADACIMGNGTWWRTDRALPMGCEAAIGIESIGRDG